MVRRVVTGVNEYGRSAVVIDEMVPVGGGSGPIWEADPTRPLPWLPPPARELDTAWLHPPNGGSRLIMLELAPASERLHVDVPRPGFDRRGFHTTRTIDYLYLIEGHLDVLLDESTVSLHSGDCLIQQATHHAIRNPGPGIVRALVVLTTLP